MVFILLLGGKLSDKLPRKKAPVKDPSFIEEKDVDLDDNQSFGEDYSDIDAVVSTKYACVDH